MTAEVVVSNKLGVAMAADSAVTITSHAGAKTYNTANKLFTVSKFHPVGIMFYGNSEISTVPWEIIIKGFRENLQKDSRPKISDYMNGFLSYLDGCPAIGASQKAKNLYLIAHNFFSTVRSSVERHLQNLAKRGNAVDQKALVSVVDLAAAAWDKTITDAGSCPSLTGVSPSDLDKHDPSISNVLDDVFKGWPLDASKKGVLASLLKRYALSSLFSDYKSGIVIAGYGDEEHYPQVIVIETDGFVADKLKTKIASESSITEENPADVLAFAQFDVSSLFIEGVDPQYQKKVMGAVDKLLEGIPDIAKNHFGLDDNAETNNKVQSLKNALKSTYTVLEAELDQHRGQASVQPLMEAVRFLDKEDAANLAESLVSLTALKRRVSLAVETVGGPIDVAFISKHDGFVWIRRKHYFKPELNPFFLQNYLNVAR
jgi:hypothetical protein